MIGPKLQKIRAAWNTLGDFNIFGKPTVFGKSASTTYQNW